MGSTHELGRSPEEGDATHSNILAWEIPQTKEYSGLQSKNVTKNQTQLSMQTLKVLTGFT